MYNHLFSRQFAQEEPADSTKEDSSEDVEDGYEFEGYKIEVSKKVLLTPITIKK